MVGGGQLRIAAERCGARVAVPLNDRFGDEACTVDGQGKFRPTGRDGGRDEWLMNERNGICGGLAEQWRREREESAQGHAEGLAKSHCGRSRGGNTGHASRFQSPSPLPAHSKTASRLGGEPRFARGKLRSPLQRPTAGLARRDEDASVS